ncbi:hypothetical protein RhiirC2_851456 [Rhizophagus irregularis]|uniref:Uncharacterized protein n=1 Tax=Rhizophagus irregularis TaxID=588596 RepID=A0A2N1N3F9_9GLOM|nr:hypothetical protein RhiirC2_851456 [Rhizophagus irregularis]
MVRKKIIEQKLKLSFGLEECFVDFEKLQCGIECCNDNSLNLAISKFCPMLRKLSTGIKNNESETLKINFNSCKYLGSLKFGVESFFVNWTNCVPQKSLSLVIVICDEENSLDKNNENIEIINKYTKLEVTDFDDDEYVLVKKFF